MAYENIIADTRGHAGLITLNRPKAMNALSAALRDELVAALQAFEADDKIGAIVITGSERAFAAGADIKEMVALDFVTAFVEDGVSAWDAVARCRKPLIAAVSGHALGGGCELAMICDVVIASEGARFGQPEITLGIMPGIGGTQRLIRAVGKAKAMEMCLTGRMMEAAEAESAGLVSRIVPADRLVEEAVKVAQRIAAMPRAAVLMIKEAINRADEVGLAEGIRFERRLFQSLFATEDQKEGMAAFVEKREAQFSNR